MESLIKYEAMLRLSVFLGGLSVLALLEQLNPKRKLTQDRYKRWFNNLVLLLTGAIAVRLLLLITAVGAAYYAEQHHLGIINHVDMPAWLKMVVVFAVLDFSIYFQHLIFHVTPVFWRLHRVHHSDRDFDVTTGLRFHPLEIVVSLVYKGVVIAIIGAPVVAVIAFEIALNVMSMFTHSNIYINKKVEQLLRYLVVTPDMHRTHHSVLENETNSNFGFLVSLWDRLFGTYIAMPKYGHDAMTIGLAQFQEDKWQNVKGLLAMPFPTVNRGYTINHRDTVNADELTTAKMLAIRNQEKATLAAELSGYIEAIGKHALVSITDASGVIIEVNDKFCDVSGYSKNELIGQKHSIVKSGYHPNTFFQEMWSTISAGRTWVSEICNKNKEGRFYWVETAISPIRNSQGEIARYLSVRIDITERKLREEQLQSVFEELSFANGILKKLSNTDGLTGLLNRRCFDESLAREIGVMGRAHEYLTLILCDIDHFKAYNDEYGHLSGDDCIKMVAKSIRSCFTRAGDHVARYGGEEIAIILTSTSKEASMRLAEKMRAGVEALQMEHATSTTGKVVTISVGVTTLVPERNTLPSHLIEQADKALYAAKHGGRNNVQYYDGIQSAGEPNSIAELVSSRPAPGSE